MKKRRRRAKHIQAIPGAWVLVRTEEAFPCLRNRYLVPSRTVADNSLPLIHMPGAAWGRKYYTPTNWKICKGKYKAAPSCPNDFVLASEGVRRNRPGSLKKSACHEMLNHHEGKPDLWDPVVSSFGWPPGRRYGGTVAAQAPLLNPQSVWIEQLPFQYGGLFQWSRTLPVTL